MSALLIPRDPQAPILTRRALDRIRDLLNDLIRSGSFVLNTDGEWVFGADVLAGLEGEAGADADTTFLEGQIAQCKNALRFLGVEPNEFPTTDSLPQEPSP